MVPLLPVSLWCPANTSDLRGSGFKYHFLQIFILNSVEFYRISFRVAMAQGKQGIWFLLFPDRENTGNFVVTQGKFLRHRENIFDCIY